MPHKGPLDPFGHADERVDETPEDLAEALAAQAAIIRAAKKSRVTKHGDHDQSDHGNWARGGAAEIERSWITAPTPGPTVGIRAHTPGGSGVSETLGRQSYGRNTGHFGTGVYFVSDASRIPDSFPASAIVGVNLEGKRLWNPGTENLADLGHRLLNNVNRLAATDTPLERSAMENLSERLNITTGAFVSRSLHRITPEELQGAIERSRELSRDLQASRDLIDSASTRVMKIIGFEGVDTRGIKNLDNTMFGSVLYFGGTKIQEGQYTDVAEVVKHADHDQSDHGNWATGESSATGTGTASDPVHTNDVSVAARALAEGKHVRLTQPRQVSTLLDRLADIVSDAKAKGAKAPNYDLCKVSVAGTNLFCAEHKGIPRAQMPQLAGVPTPGSRADALPKDAKGEVNLAVQFVEALRASGVTVEETTEKASYLRASQSELSGNKVAGMAQALEDGKLPAGSIFVSRDNYVIDGHHRWAANIGVDLADNRAGDIDMPVQRIDLDIITALKMANDFAAEWGIPQAGVFVKRLRMMELIFKAHTSGHAAAPVTEQAPAIPATDKRYTLAPVYIPDWVDAHGELAEADDLEQAVWDYVRSGDRTVYLQHSSRPAGEWVNMFVTPYPMRVQVELPGESPREVYFPAGTVFMGVIWLPWAWVLVQTGRIRGYSMGGFARRVDVVMQDVAEVAKHLEGEHDQSTHGSWASGEDQQLSLPGVPRTRVLPEIPDTAIAQAVHAAPNIGPPKGDWSRRTDSDAEAFVQADLPTDQLTSEDALDDAFFADFAQEKWDEDAESRYDEYVQNYEWDTELNREEYNEFVEEQRRDGVPEEKIPEYETWLDKDSWPMHVVTNVFPDGPLDMDDWSRFEDSSEPPKEWLESFAQNNYSDWVSNIVTIESEAVAAAVKRDINESLTADLVARLENDPVLREWEAKRDDIDDPTTTIRALTRMAIDQWAGSSGDSQPSSIAMQMVAAQKFGNGDVGLSSLKDLSHDQALRAQFNASPEPGVRTFAEYAELPPRLPTSDGLSEGLRDATPWEHAEAIVARDGVFFDRFLQAQYEQTQEQLREAGIESLVLHRGVNWENTARIPHWADPSLVRGDAGLPMRTQPLSSWSASHDTASNFGVGARGLVLTAEIPRERILGSCRTGFGCLNEEEFIVLDDPNGRTAVKFSDSFPGPTRKAVALPAPALPDENIRNADWTKKTWDLPRDPDAFLDFLGGADDLADWMRRTPAARYMPVRLRDALVQRGHLPPPRA